MAKKSKHCSNQQSYNVEKRQWCKWGVKKPSAAIKWFAPDKDKENILSNYTNIVPLYRPKSLQLLTPSYQPVSLFYGRFIRAAVF